MKFQDLQKINARYAEELKRVAAEVIDSGWYLCGERVAAFERDLSAYLGVPHVVACGNGLDALRLILRAYIEMGKVQEGDEVIVPANTYVATVLARFLQIRRLRPTISIRDEWKLLLRLVPKLFCRCIFMGIAAGTSIWSKWHENTVYGWSKMLLNL